MIVQVTQGLLEGKEEVSILTQRVYCAFLGIPYAEPPVGDLRFRAPVVARRWDGVRNATCAGNACIQVDMMMTNPKEGCEDCLNLNVYTPEPPINVTRLKPVMVYIHGGAYFSGSSSQSKVSPDYLMGQDIILVTINYRLHILGFLNLNIPACPGNCGLKDQVLALKWVKDNIRGFGGDPNNITIFGESAGGSSVHLLMLSPLSQGLFHRAIAQSGSALAPWALTEDPHEIASRVGHKLGFHDSDPTRLLEFLKQKSVDELFRVAIAVTVDIRKESPFACRGLAFVPSVEAIKEDAFLPDTPKNLMKTASPIPVITGVAEKEGVLIYYGLTPDSILQLNGYFANALKYNIPCPADKLEEVALKVRQFYFGERPIGLLTMEEMTMLFSDLYHLGMYEAYDYIRAADVPVYYYEFVFNGRLNKSKYLPYNKFNGAMHSDELGYLFHIPSKMPNPVLEDPEKTVIHNMCTMWTNFAKIGNPISSQPAGNGIEWKPCTIQNPSYLRIDHHLTTISGKIWPQRRQFWTDILESLRD